MDRSENACSLLFSITFLNKVYVGYGDINYIVPSQMQYTVHSGALEGISRYWICHVPTCFSMGIAHIHFLIPTNTYQSSAVEVYSVSMNEADGTDENV